MLLCVANPLHFIRQKACYQGGGIAPAAIACDKMMKDITIPTAKIIREQPQPSFKSVSAIEFQKFGIAEA